LRVKLADIDQLENVVGIGAALVHERAPAAATFCFEELEVEQRLARARPSLNVHRVQIGGIDISLGDNDREEGRRIAGTVAAAVSRHQLTVDEQTAVVVSVAVEGIGAGVVDLNLAGKDNRAVSA